MDAEHAVPPSPPPATPQPLSPIAALAAGWRTFLARPWQSIGVMLLLVVVMCVGELVPFVNLLFMILVAPALYAGGAWYFLRGLRGENPTIETAFESFQRWASVTGAVLLVACGALVALVPMMFVLLGSVGVSALLASRAGHTPELPPAAVVPLFACMAITYPLLIWWSARTYMTLFAVMEADRPSAMDAVKRSFVLTRGSVWRLVGLYLLCIPVALLGVLALCVGIVPAAIVMYYAFAHAYEQLRARAAATGA
jgi:uncharacterized membrane protein